MCVILIGNITKQQHETAKRQNPDGFSVYTAEYGLIKSPTAKQVEDAIGKFAIWHYRIGTSGTKTGSNIHPFKICRNKYLLYHNGILGEGLGKLSDTHALAKTLADVSLRTACSIVEALSEGQRFVIASARDPHDLLLFGKWDCHAGVLMSHKLYSYKTITTGGRGNGKSSPYDIYR